ncbi:MBOAT family protein [Enterobacter hormaechei]|uniref:MBOAT family O-acyltransferase n=1 Tax=Enterobacter hormaechei TaxID=158836 RepID=UPI00167F6597|nr:MBOAT family protein [Enterobacter hormaechei]MBD1272557.1 MBOAT family protein [Enterobacter hormaechei subsp. xiangfangensis]HCT9981707.1 MBOAT family protein [Enterobacter hormaechei]
MIFSSPEFIFIFLPVTFLIYFSLNKARKHKLAKISLVLASLYFYSYWSLEYLPLMVGSIIFNYSVGVLISSKTGRAKKFFLSVGVITNLAILGYYKYANFFLDNINALSGSDFHTMSIILPIGISFYTFTQIAFLVDNYKGYVKEFDIINYTLFVTFFPHLIAGPILHHKEMMSQFKSKWTYAIRYRHIIMGVMIFGVGLFKKTIIADTFAISANIGFAPGFEHNFISAWVASLSYTFQLYFDFSGYCDMAVGAALLFNIWLPINFNSPYKALDIQDFWRRWHITLGRYLRDYLYIPLGGNRCPTFRVYINLFITFVLGGLWHGASWMFIIWGALHGLALAIHRAWKTLGMSMPNPLAWIVTFLYVNTAWVFFRASSIQDAINILKAMIDINSISSVPINDIPIKNLSALGVLADNMADFVPLGVAAYVTQMMAILFGFFIISRKNSIEMFTSSRLGYHTVMKTAFVTVLGLYMTLHTTSAVFLYFNF